MTKPKEELPTREDLNPGDPGPPVLVPPKTADPRMDPKLPPDVKKPSPGV